MLLVGKIRPGADAYYLDLAHGTGSGIEPAGRWMGDGARRLGLSGEVEREPLGALLRGADPKSGEILGAHHHRVKVGGFDLAFCAPKSVSILHGLAAPEVASQVADSHRAAARAAISYMERRALAVRHRDNGRIPEPVTGATAAAFDHRTSRMSDPHLHTHVVVANLGESAEGRWSALDARGVYAHRAAADALYHAQLRYELTARLGVAWGPLHRGRADVAGLGVDVRREFSKRAGAIREHLVAQGLDPTRRVGPKARLVSWAATRPERNGARFEELRPQWWERAVAVGLSERRLESVLDRCRRQPPEIDLVLVGAKVERAVEEMGRPVARRDVIRALCAAMPGGAQVESVERTADAVIGRWLERGIEGRSGREAIGVPGRDLVGVAEPRWHGPRARVADRISPGIERVARDFYDRVRDRAPDIASRRATEKRARSGPADYGLER